MAALRPGILGAALTPVSGRLNGRLSADRTMIKKATMVAASSGVTLAFAALVLGVGEIAIRSVHLLRDGIPFFESVTGGRVGPITLDPELGWRATEYYEEALVEKTQKGVPYSVRRSQKQYGFRQFGDPSSTKIKMLVIGDSFTHATAVSDDRTYHAWLSKLLNAEVFAYGAGGYGTLQEYLILDRYVDLIKPNIVLWQFCINDFINNDNELELLSRVNNNGWQRPYWLNGTVVHLSPKKSGKELREWINRHSRFLYFIVTRIDKFRAITSDYTVETDIEAQGFAHTGFVRSVQVTDELMGRVRARVGRIPIIAFSCASVAPYSKALVQIASHHGIEYWDDVADVVLKAGQQGEDVLSADEHWNEYGHKLIALQLARHLKETALFTTSH